MTTVQPELDLGFDVDADSATRAAITGELGATLFVEAGAGSGKTKALVDRVVALVTGGGVPMREIVAVTFTEKAAAELRDRIRRELEKAAAAGDDRARAALEELDGAAVSTLHSFAQRVLAEHPLEAGLPPRVEVLDEIASQVEFEERWTRFVDRLLDDPAVERALLLALNADTGLDVLRAIALACNANWDLVAERMGPEPDPPPVATAAIAARARQVCAWAGECTDPEDRLAVGLAQIGAWCDILERLPDEYEALRMLNTGPPAVNARSGQKRNWRCDVDVVRAEVAALRKEIAAATRTVIEATVRRLAWEVAQFTLQEAEERRRDGRLEFHDLLVLARTLLRDPVHGDDVRRRLRERYTRLLLDEFQDTDPIQCDIAALLASGDPTARDQPWDAIEVDAGRLFVVGDPKQSIYRFRRADIGAFLRARLAFGGAPRHLTRNFRTTRPVIEFVNHVFRDLIVAEPESQPEYVALVPTREAAPLGPGPVLLGVDPHTDAPGAGPLREREAADVAAVIATALAEGWPVARRGPDGDERWEPCRLGDIAVLLPARTSLGHLGDALDAAGIPYRAETSSLVYGTREIRDLLLVLQAVDDPTDELALVSALRSPLLGCGDDDLYAFRVEHGGRWDHQAPLPASLPADHPVAEAMRALAEWHDARLWLGASELLERIVRERRLLELGFAHGRPRDLWRRVRFVVDQARAFGESGTGGLRDFLRWADLQGAEGARVVETVLPETDDDAVRILTIHGAKGLEFPIAVVSGTTTAVRRYRRGVALVFPHDSRTYALRVSSRLVTEEFERYQPIEEQMDFHEKLRLLYVALTRARDHLVVSVHRRERGLEAADRTTWTHAELLWAAAREAPHWAPFTAAPARPGDRATVAALAPFPPWEAWRERRDAALAAGTSPRVWSATAVATSASGQQPYAGLDEPADPGWAKDARDLELPPSNKGRYGTAVGRAVHAVLQTVDLATGDGVDDIAAAQAAAEGVIGRERDIAALARAAIASDIVKAAVASGDFRREMYVATAVDGHTLEGYVDLVYRTPDGLVVVDYKTDAWQVDEDLDAKVDHYRLQGASYALAVEGATGERVTRCEFLFLAPSGAKAGAVSDLARATAEVRALLAASGAAGRTPAPPRSGR